MATRLHLLCVGATAAGRAGRFPCHDDPLDRGAAAIVPDVPGMGETWCAPGRAAADTARLLGWATTEADELADVDYGDWAGAALSDLDRDAVAAWLAGPGAGTPGGEPLAAVRGRVAEWMEARVGEARILRAITYPAVVRAAIAHALGIPDAAATLIDIAPLSMTTLSFQGRWRLQEIRRATPDGSASS